MGRQNQTIYNNVAEELNEKINETITTLNYEIEDYSKLIENFTNELKIEDINPIDSNLLSTENCIYIHGGLVGLIFVVGIIRYNKYIVFISYNLYYRRM